MVQNFDIYLQTKQVTLVSISLVLSQSSPVTLCSVYHVVGSLKELLSRLVLDSNYFNVAIIFPLISWSLKISVSVYIVFHNLYCGIRHSYHPYANWFYPKKKLQWIAYLLALMKKFFLLTLVAGVSWRVRL